MGAPVVTDPLIMEWPPGRTLGVRAPAARVPGPGGRRDTRRRDLRIRHAAGPPAAGDRSTLYSAASVVKGTIWNWLSVGFTGPEYLGFGTSVM